MLQYLLLGLRCITFPNHKAVQYVVVRPHGICMSHCNKFTPCGARLMRPVEIPVFISTADGVWETEEMLSKQRLHKPGLNADKVQLASKGL